MREQNATWKFGSGELLIGERKYQLIDGEKSLQSCRKVLLVMQRVVVPRRSQLDVMANVINNQPMTRIQPKMTSDVTDWMTETGVIESGLHVSRTLVSDTDLHVQIRLMNLFDRPGTVEEGTFLTEMQPSSIVSSVQEVPPNETEFKRQLLEDIDPSVGRAERHQLSLLIDEFQDVVSQSEYDLGQTDIVKHTIDTADHRPIKQALRRHPPSHQQTPRNRPRR